MAGWLIKQQQQFAEAQVGLWICQHLPTAYISTGRTSQAQITSLNNTTCQFQQRSHKRPLPPYSQPGRPRMPLDSTLSFLLNGNYPHPCLVPQL